MRVFLAVAVTATIMGVAMGRGLACDQDIFCPDGWMWSDNEGSCIEAPQPTI